MNRAQLALARAKNFTTDHKTAIIVAVTATATTVVCALTTRALSNGYAETVTEFLAEKGLTEEFNSLLEDVTN